MQNCHNFDQQYLLNYLQCPISDGRLIIESFVSFWHKIFQAYFFFPITIYSPYTHFHLYLRHGITYWSKESWFLSVEKQCQRPESDHQAALWGFYCSQVISMNRVRKYLCIFLFHIDISNSFLMAQNFLLYFGFLTQ